MTSHENVQAAATPTPEPAMDTVSDMRTLSAGMTGDDVLEVQTRLNALKYDLEDALGLPIDVIHAPLPEDSMIRPGKVVRVL